jgi:hypothetical protein
VSRVYRHVWWKLEAASTDVADALTDDEREEIARLIGEGMTSGTLVQEVDDWVVIDVDKGEIVGENFCSETHAENWINEGIRRRELSGDYQVEQRKEA